MNFLKRMGFWILTNIAVMIVISIILSILNNFFPGLISSNGGMVGLLIYSAIIGFAGSLFSLFISRWSAKKGYGIELLDAQTAAQNPKLQIVWKTVERIARQENITMPEVGFYESADPNAFATGASKNSALVAVSTGLLNTMDLDEIEGVVGHEMAHILNGDMVTLTLVQGVLNTFVIFLSNIVARFIDRAISGDDGEGLGFFAYNLVYIVLQVVFGFLASFVVMYVSRTREYHADLGGAKYTSKAKMLAGLKRLKKMQELEMPLSAQDKKMSAFMITEPDSMFSTHPSLDNRIKALEENYQLR